jgi:hypothetical protein
VQRRTSFAAEERGVGKHASATTGHGAPSSPSSAQKSRMSCPPCGQAGERNSPVNGESCEHSNWATNVNGTLPASTGHCSPGARSGGPPMQCGTVRVGLKPIAGLDRREDRVPMFAEAVFPDQRDQFLAGKQHIVVTHGRDHTHERVNAAVCAGVLAHNQSSKNPHTAVNALVPPNSCTNRRRPGYDAFRRFGNSWHRSRERFSSEALARPASFWRSDDGADTGRLVAI